MTIYYHGTSTENKGKILVEGFKKGKKESYHSFGNNIYCTEREEDARLYGEIVTLELEEEKLKIFETGADLRNFVSSVIDPIYFPNQIDKFADYLEQNGFAGFKVKDDHGKWLIVICDPKQIKILS